MNPEGKIVMIQLNSIQNQLSQILSELAHIIRLEYRVLILATINVILFAAILILAEMRQRLLKRQFLDLRKRIEELEKAA